MNKFTVRLSVVVLLLLSPVVFPAFLAVADRVSIKNLASLYKESWGALVSGEPA